MVNPLPHRLLWQVGYRNVQNLGYNFTETQLSTLRSHQVAHRI